MRAGMAGPLTADSPGVSANWGALWAVLIGLALFTFVVPVGGRR